MLRVRSPRVCDHCLAVSQFSTVGVTGGRVDSTAVGSAGLVGDGANPVIVGTVVSAGATAVGTRSAIPVTLTGVAAEPQPVM